MEFPLESWALNRSSPGSGFKTRKDGNGNWDDEDKIFFDNVPSSAASLESSGTNLIQD